MASLGNRRDSRIKVSEYRARLRAQGLRPIQFWVPDTRNQVFREEAHRQSMAVANSSQAGADQDFIDSVSDWGDA